MKYLQNLLGIETLKTKHYTLIYSLATNSGFYLYAALRDHRVDVFLPMWALVSELASNVLFLFLTRLERQTIFRKTFVKCFFFSFRKWDI